MLLIGVDEAGYGPMLGPLVVAGSAFRVEGDTAPRDAAARLDAAFRAAGLRVDDSKRLFGARRDVDVLARPLLALAGGVSGLDALLAAAGAAPAARGRVPWYSGPAATTLVGDADLAARTSSALAGHGVAFAGLAAEVIPEAEFNAAMADGNKADLLFATSARVFERLAAARHGGEPVAVAFDRQGGRRQYGATLQRRWPAAFVAPLAETAERSEYAVRFAAGPASVAFQVAADGDWPQTALASMLAKTLREAFMDLFNAHFAPICPGVPPTAGYVEDARRWLAATRAARLAAGVPDAALVRTR